MFNLKRMNLLTKNSLMKGQNELGDVGGNYSLSLGSLIFSLNIFTPPDIYIDPVFWAKNRYNFLSFERKLYNLENSKKTIFA